ARAASAGDFAQLPAHDHASEDHRAGPRGGGRLWVRPRGRRRRGMGRALGAPPLWDLVDDQEGACRAREERSMKARILAFAGSSRRESLNKRLAGAAVTALRAAGGEVTHLDLRDFPMPLYDGDLEAAEGLPENVKTMKAHFLAHDGLLL